MSRSCTTSTCTIITNSTSWTRVQSNRRGVMTITKDPNYGLVAINRREDVSITSLKDLSSGMIRIGGVRVLSNFFCVGLSIV